MSENSKKETESLPRRSKNQKKPPDDSQMKTYGTIWVSDSTQKENGSQMTIHAENVTAADSESAGSSMKPQSAPTVEQTSQRIEALQKIIEDQDRIIEELSKPKAAAPTQTENPQVNPPTNTMGDLNTFFQALKMFGGQGGGDESKNSLASMALDSLKEDIQLSKDLRGWLTKELLKDKLGLRKDIPPHSHRVRNVYEG